MAIDTPPYFRSPSLILLSESLASSLVCIVQLLTTATKLHQGDLLLWKPIPIKFTTTHYITLTTSLGTFISACKSTQQSPPIKLSLRDPQWNNALGHDLNRYYNSLAWPFKKKQKRPATTKFPFMLNFDNSLNLRAFSCLILLLFLLTTSTTSLTSLHFTFYRYRRGRYLWWVETQSLIENPLPTRTQTSAYSHVRRGNVVLEPVAVNDFKSKCQHSFTRRKQLKY